MGNDDFLKVMHELVAFVRVAEAGSFSTAARRQGQTPSAVSRQVARLERAMGVSLLQRSTRQLRLTDAGLEVLERGREMVAAAQATLRVAEGHVGEPRGRVRISAPKAFARHVLHQPLLDFLQRHRQVDVQLLVADRPVDPLREGIDLVVRLTDDPPQGLVARALMPVRQWVVASPGYLAAHEAIQRPEDLMAHSCLSLGEQARDSRWRFSRADEAVEVVADGRYTVNHSEMRLAAVEAGLGVGCVPDFVAHEALAAGRVVRLLPEWAFDTNYQGVAYLLFSASCYTAPKMRALIDHLVAALRPAPVTAAG
ncbi:LysR family transcriptional regulator [Aquincola tertiaricarbonis]|uniref:LysR family transcriptional regulator n=1 Tax=Aquincola tertiaricarbonis TaxID=391953 RepID=A0ABY4SF55_AQUTE|nr:LysR family transcriptional regulator [Aquincola tertiaricarbonis]URI10785.1 LysR family transcriptional regulator [Aquincola tertiaricarbonis]